MLQRVFVDDLDEQREYFLKGIATLRSGMTLGIGGWGPRRKPMALVREICRGKSLPQIGKDFGNRHGHRDILKAVQPGDFLHQVDLPFDIDPERRD